MQPTSSIIFQQAEGFFFPVVPLAPGEKLLSLDLSESNADFPPSIFLDPPAFDFYISERMSRNKARYAIGGYAELRAMYAMSTMFDASLSASPGFTTVLEEMHYPGRPQSLDEPRRLHLGMDLWGPEGTPVFAPLGGMVHSTGYHPQKGNYGGTLILLHQLQGLRFHTLYGHLSAGSATRWSEGQYVSRGQQIAELGVREENGEWPPHLHFQIIHDMEMFSGDYPGVCKFSEREKYLRNCPDPALLLPWKQAQYVSSAG